MFEPGDRVGDYEIVAKLKSGGMASLFLGRRLGAAGFAKHVAIKVVHEHLAEDPAFVRMFVDEALLSARITHPNVVHVEELRERDGRHFLVMEYVRGVSLWQLLATLAKRGRRMNPEVAVHIAVKVADGLHAAHETRGSRGELLGVVHRDVSPQNVLLSYQGTVKLIDFGVAKARGRLEETSGSGIKGKFRYMSPEQAWGRAVDRRADVYALGVVLWEMLTMRRRFETKDDALILELVRDPEPVPPSEMAEGIGSALDAVVMKAQATRPEDRYQTAEELRTALLRAVPDAALMHETQIGSLLRLVMAQHIEKEAARLPQSVTGLTSRHLGEAELDEEPLVTMTISDADIASHEPVTETGSPTGEPTHPSTPPLAARTPATPATPFTSSIAPDASVRPPANNALAIVAISAAMIAAALFGVVVVLGAHLADDDAGETVVRPSSAGTSLPPLSSTAPTSAAVADETVDASVDVGPDVVHVAEEAPRPVREPDGTSRRRRARDESDIEDPPTPREPHEGMRRPLITDSF